MTTHIVSVEPWRSLVDDGRRREAWAAAAPAWSSALLGPHLDRLGRAWTSRFASPAQLGGAAGLVGRAELADRAARRTREIDIVVLAPGERAGSEAEVQAIGEVKLVADVDAVAHLDRCAELLEARGNGRPAPQFVVAETFTPALQAVATARSDVDLVGLDVLYGVDRRPRR